jgi:hypothetical protein
MNKLKRKRVTNIREVQPCPSKEVIDGAKHLLRRAKSGDVTGFAAVAISQGGIRTWINGSIRDDVFRGMGALEFLSEAYRHECVRGKLED